MLQHLFAIAFHATPALADAVKGIEALGGSLPAGSGTFSGILLDVATTFVPIVTAVVILAMTIIGFFLTITGSESQESTARKIVIGGLSAVVLINLALVLATAYTQIVGAPNSAAGIISDEIRGFVTFLEFPLGVLCVIMIIISGVRAIANFGSEDGTAQIRRTVLFVIAGFILIYTRRLLGEPIVAGSPSGIMTIVIGIADRVVRYAALLALGMIVYAAILMIANIGKDDQYTKAKDLIIRVGIGLVVLVASYAIIRFMIGIVG